MPIVTVCFLGYSLPEYDNVALVVNNRVMNAITKEEIEKKNDLVLEIDGEEIQGLEEIANYLHKGTLDEELLNSLAYEEDYDESIKNTQR